MSSSTNTLRTNEAVCLAVPPKNGQRKSGPTSEGEPRVGAFFFINHGVENGSLSSLSSALTMYTDAEIMENRTDYPVVVDYALNIATSTHTSVSGLSEVLQMNPQQPRKLFNVFRRKASQAQEATVDLDCEAYPNITSKDNQSALDNRINSTDPTIDIENQASQEESDRSLPIAPAPSVSQKVSGVSDLDLESIGFAGYINQNFSINSPRRVKLFFMATCVFLLFAIGAVVAALTSGSNTSDKQANSSVQSVSFNNQSPTPPLETTSSSSVASQAVDDDSNDGAAHISTASITSTTPTATTLLLSTTAATALEPAASSSMSTASTAAAANQTQTPPLETTSSSSVALQAVDDDSNDGAAHTSTASITSTTPTATSLLFSTTAATGSTTAAASTGSTTAAAVTTSSSTVPAKLSSINLQPLAASNLSDKGKPSFFRYDISGMLTNSLEVHKVVMSFQSNVDKKGEMITVEYLPKASNWNCNKCGETEVPSTNSITVGTLVLTEGESVYYMDLSPAFTKGIFGGQMTFKLSHSKRRRVKEDEKKEDKGKNKNDNDIVEERAKDTSFLDPTLVIVLVEGNSDEFAGLSLVSLMEKVYSSSFVDRLL